MTTKSTYSYLGAYVFVTGDGEEIFANTARRATASGFWLVKITSWGKTLQCNYNDLNILQSANDNNNRQPERSYYPDGTVKSLKSGSLYTEYAYDTDRNLTSLKTVLGGEVLVDNRYSYDRNGNRTERQQSGGATRYTYYSVNQLTKIEYPLTRSSFITAGPETAAAG